MTEMVNGRCKSCEQLLIAESEQVLGMVKCYHLMTEHPDMFNDEFKPLIEDYIEEATRVDNDAN